MAHTGQCHQHTHTHWGARCFTDAVKQKVPTQQKETAQKERKCLSQLDAWDRTQETQQTTDRQADDNNNNFLLLPLLRTDCHGYLSICHLQTHTPSKIRNITTPSFPLWLGLSSLEMINWQFQKSHTRTHTQSLLHNNLRENFLSFELNPIATLKNTAAGDASCSRKKTSNSRWSANACGFVLIYCSGWCISWSY